MRLLTVAVVGFALAGCWTEPEKAGALFSAEEMTKIQALSPLPEVPPEPSNRFADDPRAAQLGQRFFFEKAYSGPIVVGADGVNGGMGAVGEAGKIACSDCHAAPWYDDQRSKPNAVSLGIAWGDRNSGPIVNAAFYETLYWDGRADSLWMQAALAAENMPQQGSNRLRIAHVIYQKYRDEYQEVFGEALDPALDPSHPEAARFPASARPKRPGAEDGPWETMTAADRAHVTKVLVNFSKAISAFERLLISRSSAFDRFVAGDEEAISASAKRGLKLFIGKAACDACHNTPLFSDNKYYNTGVPQDGDPEKYDTGRFAGIPKLLMSAFNAAGAHSDAPSDEKLAGLAATEADRGRFRTKHLRQVALTGPYMHNGRFATLREVVEFYNDGGDASRYPGTKDPLLVPLNLSSGEIDDLVAFLETLTGEPISAELTRDTSIP